MKGYPPHNMIIATILVVLSALFTPVLPVFAQDAGVTITNVSPTQTTFNIASGEITFSASASSASAPVTLEIAGYTEDAYPDGTPTFLSGCSAYQAKANGTYATDTTYTATLPNGHYYLVITAFTSGTDRVTQGHAFTVCDSQVPDFESSYDMITLGRQIRPMDSNPPAEWVDEENRSPVDESTYRTTTTNIHFHSSVRSYMYFPFYNEIWVYPVKNFPNGAPAYVLYTSVFSSPMFTATIDGTTSLNAGPYVVKYYAYNTSNYNFELQDFRHICVDGIVGSGNNPATVFARSPGSTNIPAPSGGPSAPDPVNLADGSDANLAGVDLSSYNPIGPSASFERAYYSRQACAGYGSPGLPVGWVHNYDFVIQGTSAGSWNSLELYYPNGQIDELKPQLDNGAPTGDFEHRDGTGYLVTGASSTPDGRWSSIEITDKQQMKMTFAYLGSTSGVDIYKLSSISNSLDQTLTFNWDTSRKLTSITNGTTTLLTFSYDAYGYIATVSDNNDRKVCYTCEPLYWITPRCLLTVSQIGATNETPATHITYTYSADNNCMPLLSTMTVPSPTGSGNSTATTYYTGHWVNATVDANGNRQEYSYTTDSSGYATSTLVTTKKPNGAVVHRYTQKFDNQRDAGIIDDNQHSTSITYGDTVNYSQPTRVTHKDGKHIDFTYDQYGNLLTFTDARGVVTTNTYAYTNFTMGRLMESQTGSLTPTTISYNEPEGYIDTMTTPKPGSTTGETVTTSFTYDTLGNVLTIVAPGKNEVSSITTTMNYTTDGGYSQDAALGQPLTVTDDLSHVTHYRYDGRGFPVTITNANGNETDISYNLAGQVTEVTLPATGQTGNGNSHSVNSYLYPGGPCQSSITYDENDDQVSATTMSYGAEGEVLGQAGDQQAATYSYDPLYRVATLTDGNSHTTSYTYDLIGRLTQVTMPGNETLQYTAFDTADRPTQRTDGNSVITNYSYNDDAGLLTAISYPATTSKNVSFSYDGYGRRAQMTDSTGEQTYSYDDGSGLASVTTTYTGLDAQTISYEYNPDGSRAQMTTPAGAFSYSYDDAGRPTGLTDPNDMTSSWTYRADGALLTQTLGNDAVTTYTPNALGQITALTNSAPDSSTLSSFTGISYDGLGNKLSILATLTNLATFSGTTTFSYDAKSQLLSEASTRGDDYSLSNVYDSAGNPTTYRGVTATYNANNQRTGTDFSYDSNGNTTLNHDISASYDAENRLTQYDTLSANYNGDGLRAWKDTGEQRTYYLYDGVEPVCELVSSGSSLTVTAVNSFGAHGLLSRTEPGVRTLWYQFDSEGNVTQRLDNDGDVLSTDRFDAWGNLLDGGDTTDPFGYKAQAGYYTDYETGLVLCTFRFYDPQTGRWLTRDPIGYAGGMNLYGYCGNDPVSGFDPLGWCDKPSWVFQTGDWIDKNIMFGSVGAFGDSVGRYDFGDASGWEVAGRGAFAATMVVTTAVSIARAGVQCAGKVALKRATEEVGLEGAADLCLTEETPVATPGGKIPIASVNEQNIVWAFGDESCNDNETLATISSFCASTPSITTCTCTPNDQVKEYDPLNGQWVITQFSQVKENSEIVVNKNLFRVDANAKLEIVPDIDVTKLCEADRIFIKANYRFPDTTDVVMVLDQDMKFSRHAILGILQARNQICFQGRVYDLRAGFISGTIDIVDTGIVSARVTKIFQHTGEKAADTIIDVTIRTADGKQSILHATSNHPFFVPNRKEYVELGKLKPGTKLQTADHREATIVVMNSRKGKFDVFNLEVEGPHNYYVGEQKVLVHNKPYIDSGRMANIIGATREAKVAELVGGAVSREKIVAQGLGSTDIDVLGQAGELIGVGGPAKAGNLAKLGRQLQILKAAAAQRGVPALYYFAKDTPQTAIDLAIKHLGGETYSSFEIQI